MFFLEQSPTSDLSPSLSLSSEDELDVLLNGTPDQKKKLIREYLTGESESSSGDEFEKEMEAELSSTIKTMEGTWGPTAPGNTHLTPALLLFRLVNVFKMLDSCFRGRGGDVLVIYPAADSSSGGAGGRPSLPNPRLYDNIYFDSDSEEEDKPSKHNDTHRCPSSCLHSHKHS